MVEMVKKKAASTKAKGIVAKKSKAPAPTKHYMLFEYSTKEPVKLNMKVIDFIPGKKARTHRIVVPRKKVLKGKGKSAEDEIVSEIYS